MRATEQAGERERGREREREKERNRDAMVSASAKVTPQENKFGSLVNCWVHKQWVDAQAIRAPRTVMADAVVHTQNPDAVRL